MLNKIFISHWKITLIISTLGLIAWAVIAALYWIPPLARVIEMPITLEELIHPPVVQTHEKPGATEKMQSTPMPTPMLEK